MRPSAAATALLREKFELERGNESHISHPGPCSIGEHTHGADIAGVIYAITCIANGRVYIGSTTRGVKQRYSEHLHYLRKGSHHSLHLQRCFNKHGEKALSVAVVEIVDDRNFLLAREQFHIWRNAGVLLNGSDVSDSTLAANKANRGRVMGDEEKARRSAALKAAYAGVDVRPRFTEETRGKMRDAWKARKQRQKEPEGLPDWIAKYQGGMTLRQIIEQSGVSRRALSKWLKAKGIEFIPRKRTDEQVARAVSTRVRFIQTEVLNWINMRSSGMSIREIQKKTGRCRKMIARELKIRGIE